MKNFNFLFEWIVVTEIKAQFLSCSFFSHNLKYEKLQTCVLLRNLICYVTHVKLDTMILIFLRPLPLLEF